MRTPQFKLSRRGNPFYRKVLNFKIYLGGIILQGVLRRGRSRVNFEWLRFENAMCVKEAWAIRKLLIEAITEITKKSAII